MATLPALVELPTTPQTVTSFKVIMIILFVLVIVYVITSLLLAFMVLIYFIHGLQVFRQHPSYLTHMHVHIQTHFARCEFSYHVYDANFSVAAESQIHKLKCSSA